MWSAWRQDPVTGVYGPAEVAAAVDLAWLFEQYVRGEPAAKAAEVRLRMDGLGLTPKGKRDLRWRVAEESAPSVDEVARVRERRSVSRDRVRAVDPG